VRHGDASIGVISVAVDNGGFVDGTIYCEREQALVPMNMTKRRKKLELDLIIFRSGIIAYPER
jgi:hypothetical protein